jgi:hypothetical protein
MAYTINLTNGTRLTTIEDGTVNSNSTSITLVGKNYAGYGTFLNTDLVHMLENFASTTTPSKPLTGQLWWDSAGNLKVYNGSSFKTLSTVTSSEASPTNAVTGNSWWDSANNQLYVFDGVAWVLIGPAFASNVGQSGVEVGTIPGDDNQNHVAVNVYVSSTLIGIISKDTEYTPNVGVPISGFTTIKPGFNLSTAIANIAFVGTATNANELGFVSSNNYARTDVSTTFNSTVQVGNDAGLTVGANNNFTVGVSGNVTQLINNINNANIAIISNVSGSRFEAMSINGITGQTTIANLTTPGVFSTAGAITASFAQDATSNVTGAIRVTNGGIGVNGNIFTSNSFIGLGSVRVNGEIRANANLTILSTDNAVSSSTGAIRTAGGIMAAKDIISFGNVQGNFFSGVATRALYADLAERFEADAVYEPGTLVSLGGEKEVTLSVTELGDDVFGVVSTNPAYLMNSDAGTNETHPPIALSGRVPVNVVGAVVKGDRLVSAGNGVARTGNASEITPFNVIGRALEDNSNDGVKKIYAIVKLNS